MDDQKRQKVMLGVLAAAALAAGGFFFMSGGSDDKNAKDASANYVGRKVRKVTDADSRKSSRKVRAPRNARNKVEAGRQERIARPTAGKTTRRSRRGKAKLTKKKKMVPAA